MKILHIVNWYPTADHPYSALWIDKHIQSLPNSIKSTVWHIEVKKGRFSFRYQREIKKNYSVVFCLPFEVWFINELIYTFLVLWLCFVKLRKEEFDLFNFHIAYPLATYLHLYKKYLKAPVVYTEHWSAYHFHFHIKGSPKLKRVQKIFQHGIPVIAVSEALANDIKDFSCQSNFDSYIIPNIVATDTFYHSKLKRKPTTFFMVSQWKEPKDPFTVIRSIREVVVNIPDIHLRIGGYGPQYTKMQDLCYSLNIQNHITFLDALDAEQIAQEMNIASGFIHCSGYETFSVVCAEALCCGTPVIASDVGGIKELVHKENGILFSQNTVDHLTSSLLQLVEKINTEYFDLNKISEKAIDKYSSTRIGNLYEDTLVKIVKKSDCQ